MRMLARFHRVGVHAAIALFALAVVVKPSLVPPAEVLETFLVLVGMSAICMSARLAAPSPVSSRPALFSATALAAARVAAVLAAAALLLLPVDAVFPLLDAASLLGIAAAAAAIDRHLQALAARPFSPVD